MQAADMHRKYKMQTTLVILVDRDFQVFAPGLRQWFSSFDASMPPSSFHEFPNVPVPEFGQTRSLENTSISTFSTSSGSPLAELTPATAVGARLTVETGAEEASCASCRRCRPTARTDPTTCARIYLRVSKCTRPEGQCFFPHMVPDVDGTASGGGAGSIADSSSGGGGSSGGLSALVLRHRAPGTVMAK